jgi:hypothetical protein
MEQLWPFIERYRSSKSERSVWYTCTMRSLALSWSLCADEVPSIATIAPVAGLWRSQLQIVVDDLRE